jgi:hypothetical protein
VILSGAIDVVQTMFGEKCAQEPHNIPLWNNTVSRHISDILEDLEEPLIEKLRNKRFLMEIGEATYSGIGHLIAYVRHVEGTGINEDMLFCNL